MLKRCRGEISAGIQARPDTRSLLFFLAFSIFLLHAAVQSHVASAEAKLGTLISFHFSIIIHYHHRT